MNHEDDLEVKVDVPLTDNEIFGHLIFGQKPQERPIIMKRSEYKTLRNFQIGILLLALTSTGAFFHYEINKNYGSISNAYKSLKETHSKIPYHALTP